MRIDLSGPVRAGVERALADAAAAEQDGRWAAAAEACEKAASLMTTYAGYAATRADELRRLQKARGYLARAGELRARPADARPAAPPRAAERRAGGRGGAAGPVREAQPDENLDAAVLAMIDRSAVRWADIGGLEETKREIKFAYGQSLARPPEGVSLPGWRRLLFYGPPGTGKTLLAAATSSSLNATFFNVKVGSLLSKWFGESPKLVAALFALARDRADEGFAVVFIDEAESLGLSRDRDDQSGAERRVLSALLSELEGFEGKRGDDGVLTIAATNAPWDVDGALLSRFEKRIYIPLPDAPARRAIVEILLRKPGLRLDLPVDAIVDRTEWFSGRDLERLVKQAVRHMVEELNGDVPALVDRGREAIEAYELRVRPLAARDFDEAFGRIRVDVRRLQELEARYRAFAEAN